MGIGQKFALGSPIIKGLLKENLKWIPKFPLSFSTKPLVIEENFKTWCRRDSTSIPYSWSVEVNVLRIWGFQSQTKLTGWPKKTEIHFLIRFRTAVLLSLSVTARENWNYWKRQNGHEYNCWGPSSEKASRCFVWIEMQKVKMVLLQQKKFLVTFLFARSNFSVVRQFRITWRRTEILFFYKLV